MISVLLTAGVRACLPPWRNAPAWRNTTCCPAPSKSRLDKRSQETKASSAWQDAPSGTLTAQTLGAWGRDDGVRLYPGGLGVCRPALFNCPVQLSLNNRCSWKLGCSSLSRGHGCAQPSRAFHGAWPSPPTAQPGLMHAGHHSPESPSKTSTPPFP